MTRPLVLVAASGLAREVLASLRGRADLQVVGLLDDGPHLQDTRVGGLPVLGPVAAAVDHPDVELVLCAGSGVVRSTIRQRLLALGVGDDRFATVVDPSVRIPACCSVGAGSIVLGGTVLTADVTVGCHVVVMPNATLTHDDRVDDFATLCAGVTLGGAVHVRRTAYLGMSSSVRQHLVVGVGSTLGMGAALTRDLPDGETWVGVPARRLAPAAADRPVPSTAGEVAWSA